MTRSTFIKNITLTGGGLLLSKYASFASALKGAGYTIEMLTDDIGIFSEKGGTILFYLGKKGVTVVDTQFADTATNLINDLKGKGKVNFELLINTHHHGDHTSGNIAFKDLVTTVVGHTNCLKNHKITAEKSKTVDKQLFANTTFDTTWKKKLGKEKVVAYYFGAAHTDGDIVVHFTKQNIVHVGDLVFNRRFPFIDKTAGANIKSWIKVLQQIQTTFNDDTKFVCGHANTGYKVIVNKADIKAFENYLSALLTQVGEAVKAGKAKEEILKITTITNAPEWTGDGILRSLNAAYAELVEEKG